MLVNNDLQNLVIQNLEISDFLHFKVTSHANNKLLFNSAEYINYKYSIIDHIIPTETYIINGENNDNLNYIKSFLDCFGFEKMEIGGKVKYIYMAYEGHSSISMIPFYLDFYNSLVKTT